MLLIGSTLVKYHMWIGSLEEIKCGDYCEYHCENFIIFWGVIPIK
jgi:hypothetical protein